MNIVKKLIGWLATAFTLSCVVTVAAQFTGFALASSQGLLTSDKLLRYAGILYGLDPLDLLPPKPDSKAEPKSQTREEILAERVRTTNYVAERISVLNRDAEDVRASTAALKRNREKYIAARDGFESLLSDLEQETQATALRELQVTIEVTSPKQAKEILTAMLASAPADKSDDVLDDVTQVIKTMPDNRLRKILAEFKTEDERMVLHRLLLEIGKLNVSTSVATGGQP